MAENLVIVESPAKSKTIEKYLGKGFKVMASIGHVRDLVAKEGAVDPANGYAMRYAVIERSEKQVDKIAREVKKAKRIYLATDPDREGEAISWHLAEILRERGLLDDREVHRVVFYEITKRAVLEAMESPGELSQDMVNAQQARRALDHLVGFNLSPLLWKKIRRGLSAGRVQSPALRMICEREDEIEAFVPQEYWTVEADVAKDSTPFIGRLVEYQGDKVEQFTITNEDQAGGVEKNLLDAADGKLLVHKITRKQRRRSPPPPFTTSTLQQEASRKLGFSAKRTMGAAQKLYQGVDVGDGEVGLISYMRTDSVALSQDAVEELREVIGKEYGKENIPAEPNTFKTKSRNAQEAHEAIRPTSADMTPKSLRGKLDPDLLKLYELIWKRAVACQMVPAIFDTVAVDLLAGPAGDKNNRFRANGSILKEPGFLAVYQADKQEYEAPKEDQVKKENERDRILPPMEEGEMLTLSKIRPEQHFTEPPPRFTEASLVKSLEEFGIGRPSTYASIIEALRTRVYVDPERRRFFPTDIGRVVSRFLTEHFHDYVDYEFTARLEADLDAISRGESDWIKLLERFWTPFIERVENKQESVTREQAAQARQLGTDPKSGRPVSVRIGRYGPFVQIGTRDDEEKPKFAGLLPGQKMDLITFEEGMELFKLPRDLGETAEGEKVSASVGRFGPYVKYGSKYVSLKGEDAAQTITLERALEVIAEKKIADANRIIHDFEEAGIQVLNGRYGPYVTNKEKNARIPKDVDPKTLTLEQCQEMIANAPERRGKKKAKKKVAESKKTKKKATKKKATKKKARKKASKKKTAKKKTTKKKAAKKKTTKKAAASGAAAGDA